jgi:tRNA(Glu) U13 pseudouridine synthase TruD
MQSARLLPILRRHLVHGFGSSENHSKVEGGKLERHLWEIAVELILTSEFRQRERAVPRHQWRAERRAELEEEKIQRKLKAERAERERRKRLEQARIDCLLKDAVAFQQAGA